jgi:hypothetical protein
VRYDSDALPRPVFDDLTASLVLIALLVGAGEGAAAVAEQLALDEGCAGVRRS